MGGLLSATSQASRSTAAHSEQVKKNNYTLFYSDVLVLGDCI